MDCIVHGVAKSQTRLSDFHFHFRGSLIASQQRLCLQYRRLGFNTWIGTIPWRRERLPTPVFWPGEFQGLYWVAKSRTRQSDFHLQLWNVLRCRRPNFDWIRKIPWRKEWLPTPVFLPGEFHGQRSLASYSSWGRKMSDND